MGARKKNQNVGGGAAGDLVQGVANCPWANSSQETFVLFCLIWA